MSRVQVGATRLSRDDEEEEDDELSSIATHKQGFRKTTFGTMERSSNVNEGTIVEGEQSYT